MGQVVDKVRELGIAENTLIVWTTDNGAWQDVYPDCGYTPYRGTKGTDYEGGSRVPAIAWWFYMTETEMIPGAIRLGKWKAVWNVRDGWRGPASYTAIVPELFDLWQDPQERYDIGRPSQASRGGEGVVGRMRGRADTAHTTDELMALLRDE